MLQEDDGKAQQKENRQIKETYKYMQYIRMQVTVGSEKVRVFLVLLIVSGDWAVPNRTKFYIF